MPADYSSTAKALALPISPSTSPSPESHTTRPPWSRRISGSSRRAQTASPYSLAGRTSSYKDQILTSAHTIYRRVVRTFNALTPVQRVLAIGAIIMLNVTLVLFFIYYEKIFGFIAPAAKRWHDVTGGWIVLWIITFCAAFPPLIGYSTCVTIAGFVYGFPNGWFIASTATVCGSLVSFIASRTVLSAYVHRLVGTDKRFEALALTLKHDGLKILCMIRFCPLPYSLSNAAMSTFPTVQPLSFALATAISTPKLLVHVFIGSRLARLAEGGQEGHQLDASTKAINYASIAVGSIMGATVGYIIYQRTMARAKQLELEELEAGNADPLGTATNGAARDQSYSDGGAMVDPDAAALMDDDDISLWDTERIEDRDPAYRDDYTDDDDDVFARGDVGDGNPAVVKQGKRKGAI